MLAVRRWTVPLDERWGSRPRYFAFKVLAEEKPVDMTCFDLLIGLDQAIQINEILF